MGLAYDEGGDPQRPLVVLLHGGGTLRRFWEPQWAALTARFHVLAPDLCYEDWNRLTLPALAQDVAALVRARHQRAWFVGLSLGGAVALQTALDAPDTAAGLLLSGTLVEPDARGRLIGVLLALIPEALLVGLLLRVTRRLHPALSPPAVAEIRRVGKAGLRASVRALSHIGYTARLADIAVPSLVVIGARDLPTLHAASCRLAAALPGAQHRLIPDAGHAWNLDHADLFNQTVIEFVEQNSI